MTEDEFVEIVGRVNEAAFGVAPWSDAGAAVARALDCSRVTLLFGPPDGLSYVDLMVRSERDRGTEPPIPPRYRALDPSLAQSVEIAANRLDLKEVAHVFEMVPERRFRRSEYYADFARSNGFYHRLGFNGIRGGQNMAPFAVHRPEHATPFDEADRAALLQLKPHVKRALALRERLPLGSVACGTGFEALNVSREAALVVDSDFRLVYANTAAEKLLCVSDSPLRIVAEPHDRHRRSRLSFARMRHGESIASLIRGVALGVLAGGTRRLCAAEASGPGIVVRASPLPARLMDGARLPSALPGLALLVISDLRRSAPPSPDLLADLFGLSRAESDVTIALTQGATAEVVAIKRGVAVQTVRTQIRTILAKVGATNIRDLERIMARLPRMHVASHL